MADINKKINLTKETKEIESKISEMVTEINDTSSNVENIENYCISGFTFNLDKGLSKFKGSKYPKMVWFGDSIIDGTGADNWYGSFSQQFGELLQIARGSLYGRGYVKPHDGVTYNGWTLNNDAGLNHYRLEGTDATIEIFSNVGWNKQARKIDILYSTEEDGGTIDVLVNDATVETINCNGTTSYTNKVTVEVPAASTLKLTATGKGYIEGYIQYGYGGLTDGVLLNKVSHGGKALTNYSDAELNSVVSLGQDFTVIEHITNDYSVQDLPLFEEKYRYIIQKAKTLGDVLLIIPVAGIGMEASEGKTYKYSQYVDVMYKLAKEYNCALIDFNKALGGYDACKNNDMFYDYVHPNQKLYDIMRNIICNILAPETLTYLNYSIKHQGNNYQYDGVKMNLPNITGGVILNFTPTFTAPLGSSANAFKFRKLQITNEDGTKTYATLDKYGNTTGSVLSLQDEDGNKVSLINAYGKTMITTNGICEFDTTSSDKIENCGKYKNRQQFEMGATLYPCDPANIVKPYTLFVDKTDNKLKFKDSDGVIKIVSLTTV